MSYSLTHQNVASDNAGDDDAPAVGEESWLMVNKDTLKQGCILKWQEKHDWRTLFL